MTYNARNYTEQGGARDVVGGSLDVISGGELDIESGGSLKLAGTAVTATAAELNQLDGTKTLHVATDTVTLAQLNAGKTILADEAGATITVVDFLCYATGTFADGTSMEIEDTNGTPVVITSVAVAAMDDAWLGPHTANVTNGAGLIGALTAGKGIAVTATGTFTGGTSVKVAVTYYKTYA